MAEVVTAGPSPDEGTQHPGSVVAALGDVLEALTRSTFDLNEVLHIVLDRAVRLCRADTADVALPDGEVYRPMASVGFAAEFERVNREATFRPGRETVIGRTLLEGRAVHVPDVLADPEYGFHDLQRVGGYRSVLGVPLLRDGATIGVIVVQRNRVAPFSDLEIELVTLFARQVAIAIQVASLMTETRQALERESAVSEVLQTISRSAFDLDQVLQTVIESAVQLSDAEFGNILRLD